jgi:hypothetical protein
MTLTHSPVLVQPIRLRSNDGRTVRLDFDGLTWIDTKGARDFASDLLAAISQADNAPELHERHVNLMASCPLCVYEAHGQLDRLTYEELS